MPKLKQATFNGIGLNVLTIPGHLQMSTDIPLNFGVGPEADTFSLSWRFYKKNGDLSLRRADLGNVCEGSAICENSGNSENNTRSDEWMTWMREIGKHVKVLRLTPKQIPPSNLFELDVPGRYVPHHPALRQSSPSSLPCPTSSNSFFPPQP
jgi:hypothetical protein